MKQNMSCLAPGAGGGAGAGAPFSRSEALSSAGFGLVSRAVMLPLRELMYYSAWVLLASAGRWSLVVLGPPLQRMSRLVNCFRSESGRRHASAGVGWLKELAGGWRAAAI